MAQSQHPTTVKVETIKNWPFLHADFKIHKQFSVFFNVFPIMQKRVAITRIWLSQERGKCCKFTIKTKVRGSWWG